MSFRPRPLQKTKISRGDGIYRSTPSSFLSGEMKITVIIFKKTPGKGSGRAGKGICPVIEVDFSEGILAGIVVMKLLLNIKRLQRVIQGDFSLDFLLTINR